METDVKTLVRPKSLTELAADSIRDWIIAGELALGAHLSEARIARDLGISRTPVREALNRLEMEGLLTVEAQRGSYVFNLEGADLAKLCDARVCLETAALSAAMEANAAALADRLATHCAAMTAARDGGDVSGYLAQDTQFHQTFFDVSDNGYLNDAYQTIALKMAAVRNRLGRNPTHMQKSYAEHLALTEAVRASNLSAALAILRQHIDRKEGSYWRMVTSSGEPAESVAVQGLPCERPIP